MRFSRFTLLFSLLALSIGCTPSTPEEGKTVFPGDAWPTATLEEVNLPQTRIDSVLLKTRNGSYGYIDRLLIIKDGYLVLDQSFDNDYREISRGKSDLLGCGWETCPNSSQLNEYNYYHPDWHPYYQGSRVHTLQSVTKSVAATVIGIALEKGAIAGVEENLLSFFPDYDPAKADPRLREATLEDLLTMQLGMEWHEMDRPLDSTNTTAQLEMSEDWIGFTLAQPMEATPGTKWVYNSGASQLLSGIIRQVTGQYIDTYAREYLFGPLGIDNFHWKKTPTGYPDTEGGLFLAAEDLARIGYLYLHNGNWAGQQILPESWVATATDALAVPEGTGASGYGYQWWRIDRNDTPVWAGMGFGGQFLLVIPDRQIVAVVNSWNLFDPPAENILTDFVDALTL